MNRFTATLEDAAQRALPYATRQNVLRFMKARTFKALRSLRVALEGDGALPFDQHNCIFVHVPKAAGVSIATALFGRRFGGHRTLRDWQLIYSRRQFEEMFTFAFVRDPWSRLYSAWRFLKAGGRNEYDARWAERHLSGSDDFDSFVRRWLNPASIWKRQHFWPQYWFVQDRPRVIGVDFIGRFERLTEDYETVRVTLGVGDPLPHLNPTDDDGPESERIEAAYTPESAAIVAEVYRTDIELLSYEAFRPC